MKKFDDLSLREMHIVLDRNTAFKQQIRNDANETSVWYIDDILRCFPRFSIEECIGEMCTIKVVDPDKFLHGLLVAQRAFHFLYDGATAKAEEAIATRTKREHIIAELEELVCEQLQAEYDWYDDDERLHEYFVDCFLGNDPETQDWTVDDDYILYTND